MEYRVLLMLSYKVNADSVPEALKSNPITQRTMSKLKYTAHATEIQGFTTFESSDGTKTIALLEDPL